jgi:WXXGXW repeat (2 copies)
MHAVRLYVRWILIASMVLLGMAAQTFAQIGISVSFGPPALPVYEQPICPGDGYIWTPGYWAYGDGDYYWVPGTWVMAPQVGFLWTPGYWGWGGNAFFFHEGYWGPRVGFYGGINYGYGYNGRGYEGGRWNNGHFYYNRSVTNVNVTVIHNVYNKNVSHNSYNRVSYNGGNGGLNARASSQQQAAAREHHIPPVAAQTQHVQAADCRNRTARRIQRARIGSRKRGWWSLPAAAGPTEQQHQTGDRGGSPQGPSRARKCHSAKYRKSKAGSEIRSATSQVERETAAGLPKAGAEAGPAAPESCPTESKRLSQPADGATASEANPAVRTEAQSATTDDPETRTAAHPATTPAARATTTTIKTSGSQALSDAPRWNSSQVWTSTGADAWRETD